MTIEQILKPNEVLTKEPMQMTLDEHRQEETLIREALNKPVIKVPSDDDLRGEPVKGYEGVYWHVKASDTTPNVGLIKSYAGVTIPSVIHTPTGSKTSYRKVIKNINGENVPVWEVHQKDLNTPHEPYEE